MALSRFWHTRGDLSEGRAALRRALEAPVAAVTRGLATALTWESALAHHQGDLDEAVALGERAVAASRVVGDPLILGMALVTFGDNLTRPGDLDRAVAALDEGVAILRAAGDCVGASIGIGLGPALLGAALRLRGDLDRAAAALEEGLALSRSIGNTWGVGIALQDLAQVARERGEQHRAAALFAECMAGAREIADSRRVAECLEGFAELAAEASQAERATRLLGAAQALRDANGSAVESLDRAIHAHSVAAARQALGEAAFTAAWNAGRALPLERAIEEALLSGGTASAAGGPPMRPTNVAPLTVREHQVAALVARGLTNPQIAEQLVISRRTADRHVSNILDKLGLATRAAVAAWAVEEAGAAARD